jgi:hypothetical protein
VCMYEEYAYQVTEDARTKYKLREASLKAFRPQTEQSVKHDLIVNQITMSSDHSGTVLRLV